MRVVPWALWEEVRRELERRLDALEQAGRTRRDRLWALGLVVIAGMVLPLIVSSLITLIHLRA